ncbi:unnamed protein product [Leptosia nina]|uniref:BTB domain-containing protein n=1 Tax=Leptosia nina TaxID=320188 RepID=A0AAV1JF12_9NEOP
MSRLLCCLRARQPAMGAALSQPHDAAHCEPGREPGAPTPTMADVIRERKKKAGAPLGTLRRRIAAAARRPRDCRPDRGCEHARFIRSVVSTWRLAEVFLLCEELESGAALRDLLTQAELAREPAAALHADLAALYRDRLWCDVELVGAGWSLAAHRVVLAARCTYFRDLLHRYPKCARVPLDGVCSGLRREECEAVLLALYAGSAPSTPPPCDACRKWERGVGSEVDLDIISIENTSTYRRSCSCRREAASVRRLAGLLGFSLDSLHRDMRYLLDSGEMCDARLSWRSESGGGSGSGGSAYGFRSALELPCHTIILAARSRFFRYGNLVISDMHISYTLRSVMSRRSAAGAGGAGGAGAVCVDEKVLPRRFAQALLHAAYTDQVDLTLISRSSSSPSSTSSSVSGTNTRGSRGSATMQLDDAFQLYEIARFLEMPIVVQGCEDAIVFALNADTLPHVLRWCAQPHASHWVHRQAMRYLRDEFPSIMSSAASAKLPRSALAEVLASPFLQASEAQALRAALRWAERAADCRDGMSEPNVVWHTAHSISRRGGRSRATRRREVNDAAVREALATLAPLIRTEHLPPDCDLLHQAMRRGLITAPAHLESACSADAWLGRGAFRPPRCFLPYLDEIKALLEDQTAPEGEVALVRRARYLHRIPDALYMLRDIAGEPQQSRAATDGVRLCVPPRVMARVRARARELRATPNAARALALHSDARPVHKQIALRAVREMALPDSCADLLLDERDADTDREGAGVCVSESEEEEGRYAARGAIDCDIDCCRSSTGSLRCGSAGSLRATPTLHIPIENRSASSSCRRELPARPTDTPHRAVPGRLSAAVPDVAMAPNGNTHLLTPHYLYTRPHPHPQPQTHQPRPEYGSASAGVNANVVQLDLGDGATHTPRPGSRAQRERAAQSSRQYRDQTLQSAGCSRSRSRSSRADEEELRVAIELSLIRAYGSLQASGRRADLLPNTDFSALRSRASPGLSAMCTGAEGGSMERGRSARHHLSVASGSMAASVPSGGTGSMQRARSARHSPHARTLSTDTVPAAWVASLRGPILAPAAAGRTAPPPRTSLRSARRARMNAGSTDIYDRRTYKQGGEANGSVPESSTNSLDL